MSNYPVWWDTTITVYNKYLDNQTQIITWFRHVITGCFWQYVKDKAILGDTILETSRPICRIRENDLFMEKHLWVNLPMDIKGNYFTLGQGDIIVKGEAEDIIDEYTTGHRSSDLIAKYKELQGCFEINIAANNTGLGRGLPHYKAQGV